MTDFADRLVDFCKRRGVGAAELLRAMQKQADGHRGPNESPEQAFARAFTGANPRVPSGNQILTVYNQLEKQRQYG